MRPSRLKERDRAGPACGKTRSVRPERAFRDQNNPVRRRNRRQLPSAFRPTAPTFPATRNSASGGRGGRPARCALIRHCRAHDTAAAGVERNRDHPWPVLPSRPCRPRRRRSGCGRRSQSRARAVLAGGCDGLPVLAESDIPRRERDAHECRTQRPVRVEDAGDPVSARRGDGLAVGAEGSPHDVVQMIL